MIPFHGQDITWYFQNWSGTDVEFEHANQTETAVVFKQPNAVAEANYKGHLITNSSTPTAPNNARRIVKEVNPFPENEPLHLVYEDGGAIWYATSTDQGDIWSPEERISEDWFSIWPCHNPAIAENNDSLHVVWVQDIEGLWYELYYRTKDLATGQWSQQVPIGNDILAPQDPIPQPGVATRYRESSGEYRVWVAIAYEEAGAPQVHTYYRNTRDAINAWEPAGSFAGETPALSGEDDALYIVYAHEGDLYAKEWLWNHDSDGWYYTTNLTEDAPGWDHRNPSLALWGEAATVYGDLAWQLDDFASCECGIESATTKIAHMRFRMAPPPHGFKSGVSLFEGTDVKHPTVSGWGNDEAVTVMYEDDGKIYRKIREGGMEGEWTGQFWGSGRQPNIAVHDHSGLYLSDAGAVWVTESSAPYIIQTDYQDTPESSEATAATPAVTESGGRIGVDSLVSFKRMDFHPPNDTTGRVFLGAGIREAYLDSTALEFDWEMRSDPLTITPTSGNVTFQLVCQFLSREIQVDSQAVLWELSLKEDQTVSHSLAVVRLVDLLPYNDGSRHVIPVSIPVSGLAGIRGKLHFERSGLASEVREVVISADSLSEHPSLLGKGNAAQVGRQGKVPERFTLSQNYPNPFATGITM